LKHQELALNLDKSQLYFFNTPVEIQNHISQLLGIPKSSLPSNYLGVPLTGEATRNISWDSLLLSISNRLSNWTFRSLNLAARLVLLKSVLQALPTYLFTALASPSLSSEPSKTSSVASCGMGITRTKSGRWWDGIKSAGLNL
jgi:hypothetical protein